MLLDQKFLCSYNAMHTSKKRRRRKKKKVCTHMRDHNFKSIWLLYGDIWLKQIFVGFLIISLIPHFRPQTILSMLDTIYEKWCSPKNCKDHTRGNYKVCPPHKPVLNPFDHCTAVLCTVQLLMVWGLVNVNTLLITALCPSQFSEGYSIKACITI